VKCVATREEGLDELVQALYAHRDWLMHSEAGARQRSRRRREQLLGFLRDELGERLIAECGPALDAAAGRVEAGATDPYAAVEELILDFALRQAR
jgi:LAO/AO transport system kinase